MELFFFLDCDICGGREVGPSALTAEWSRPRGWGTRRRARGAPRAPAARPQQPGLNSPRRSRLPPWEPRRRIWLLARRSRASPRPALCCLNWWLERLYLCIFCSKVLLFGLSGGFLSPSGLCFGKCQGTVWVAWTGASVRDRVASEALRLGPIFLRVPLLRRPARIQCGRDLPLLLLRHVMRIECGTVHEVPEDALGSAKQKRYLPYASKIRREGS